MAIHKVVTDIELGMYMDYNGLEAGRVNPLLPAVNGTSIGFTPLLTGNATNRNEVVTDPNGDVYFIDYAGDAILLRSSVQTFQAIKNTIQASAVAWANIAAWQAPVIVGTAMTFTAVTGALVLGVAGVYELSCWAKWHSQANNRTETAIKLQANGIDILAAFDQQYSIRNAVQDMGTSQVNGYLYTAAAGDIITVQEQRVGATANIEEARFIAKKIQ